MSSKFNDKNTLKFKPNPDNLLQDEFEEFFKKIKNGSYTKLDLSNLHNDLTVAQMSNLNIALQDSKIETIDFTGTNLSSEAINELKLENTYVHTIFWDKPKFPKINKKDQKQIDKLIDKYLNQLKETVKVPSSILQKDFHTYKKNVAFGLFRFEIPSIERTVKYNDQYLNLQDKISLLKKDSKNKNVRDAANIAKFDIIKAIKFRSKYNQDKPDYDPIKLDYLKAFANKYSNERIISKLEKDLAINKEKIKKEKKDKEHEELLKSLDSEWYREDAEESLPKSTKSSIKKSNKTEKVAPVKRDTIDKEATIHLMKLEKELNKIEKNLKQVVTNLHNETLNLQYKDNKQEKKGEKLLSKQNQKRTVDVLNEKQINAKKYKNIQQKEILSKEPKLFQWQEAPLEVKASELKKRHEERPKSDELQNPEIIKRDEINEARRVIQHDIKIFDHIKDILDEAQTLLNIKLTNVRERFIPFGLYDLKQDIKRINQLLPNPKEPNEFDQNDFKHLNILDKIAFNHLRKIPKNLEFGKIQYEIRDNHPFIKKNNIQTLEQLKENLLTILPKASDKILKKALEKCISEIDENLTKLGAKITSFRKNR